VCEFFWHGTILSIYKNVFIYRFNTKIDENATNNNSETDSNDLTVQAQYIKLMNKRTDNKHLMDCSSTLRQSGGYGR